MSLPTPLQFRFWAFLIGCIGSRTLFTLLARWLGSSLYLPVLGGIAIVPVIGWLYILFIEPRDTGIEVLGDPIWWNTLRPVHTLLWGFFAYLALTKNRHAWIVLGVDTLVGLGAFLIHHGREGNLRKMVGSR